MKNTVLLNDPAHCPAQKGWHNCHCSTKLSFQASIKDPPGLLFLFYEDFRELEHSSASLSEIWKDPLRHIMDINDWLTTESLSPLK